MQPKLFGLKHRPGVHWKPRLSVGKPRAKTEDAGEDVE